MPRGQYHLRKQMDQKARLLQQVPTIPFKMEPGCQACDFAIYLEISGKPFKRFPV